MRVPNLSSPFVAGLEAGGAVVCAELNAGVSLVCALFVGVLVWGAVQYGLDAIANAIKEAAGHADQ